MLDPNLLQVTAASFFGPCRVARHQSCPGGQVLVQGRALSDEEIVALGWGLRNADVEVRLVDAAQDSALAPAGAGDFYVIMATRRDIFATQPTRMIYTEAAGNGSALRLLNFKVGVHERYRGRGLSTLALGRQLAAAAVLGFDSVDVLACGDALGPLNGYAIWPRLGYGGTIPVRIWRSLPSGELATFGLNPATPVDVRRLCKTTSGWEFWAAHGAGFRMRFELRPPDPYAKVLISKSRSLRL